MIMIYIVSQLSVDKELSKLDLQERPSTRQTDDLMKLA
jgi:hypothetical protein